MRTRWQRDNGSRSRQKVQLSQMTFSIRRSLGEEGKKIGKGVYKLSGTNLPTRFLPDDLLSDREQCKMQSDQPTLRVTERKREADIENGRKIVWYTKYCIIPVHCEAEEDANTVTGLRPYL